MGAKREAKILSAALAVGARDEGVRARVKELTPRARSHADMRDVIASLNPVLRGWAHYFRTGKAATKFVKLDRLRG